jgi:F-box-like
MGPTSQSSLNLAEARHNPLQAVGRKIQVLEGSLLSSKFRHNALVPISRLPPEILTLIFSHLFSVCYKKVYHRSFLHVTHVCRYWRDTTLNYPHLWSHINFNKLGWTGFDEILARAKMAPLHLEAKVTHWTPAQFNLFERQLEPHISHIRHLSLSGEFQTVLERFMSPALALEFLSLSHSYRGLLPVIPDALFNNTTPKLTNLELYHCGISWKSPLLKGLRTLEILGPCTKTRPTLDDWLDALDKMPQLEALILHNASPARFIGRRIISISKSERIVTLPFLTRFEITSNELECVLALDHLRLPALTSLHVDAKFLDQESDDVGPLIPHVARNAHGPQDTAPLQGIVIQGGEDEVKILAWSVPDANIDDHNQITISRPRVVFTARNRHWHYETHAAILDALFTHLPVDAISTLAVENPIRLSKEFLFRHASSLVMLERIHLDPTAVGALREMLAEDTLPNGLRLPRLRTLVLRAVSLTAPRTYRLRDMLIKRMEQGAPLETLDLRTCRAADCAIKLLTDFVGEVQGPAQTLRRRHRAFFNWKGGVEFFDEKEKRTEDDEYDGQPRHWYGDASSDEDEEEDEDEDDED